MNLTRICRNSIEIELKLNRHNDVDSVNWIPFMMFAAAEETLKSQVRETGWAVYKSQPPGGLEVNLADLHAEFGKVVARDATWAE